MPVRNRDKRATEMFAIATNILKIAGKSDYFSSVFFRVQRRIPIGVTFSDVVNIPST